MSDNQDILLKAQTPNPKVEEEASVSEFMKTAILAVLLALFVRTFFFEPFNIPSGSMLPTLEVGDYLFVNKTSYGYSKHSFPLSLADFEGRAFAKAPERGDVIVFKLPSNPRIDYIKRLVGFPGDRIQVEKGRLYINGKLVEREAVGMKRLAALEGGSETVMEYIETLPGGVMHRIYEVSDNGPLDDTEEFVVPEGHYFLMGDNRDNSQDSRVAEMVGYVPFENLVGRADILFFSVDKTANLLKPWTWPGAIRYSRIFHRVEPARDAAAEKAQ